MNEGDDKETMGASPVAPEVRSELVDEIRAHCFAASKKLTEVAHPELFQHAARVLQCFDLLAPIMHRGDIDIIELLRDTREELLDSYLAFAAGRIKLGFIMLRGVMEGLLTTMYYRQQTISLNLWASGDSFEMVHKLLDAKHEFRLYFKRLLQDERFTREFPQVTANNVFDEAVDIYDKLSSFVHKKSRVVKAELPQSFEGYVEDVLRVTVCFLEREEELPKLSFPAPASIASVLLERKTKLKAKKK